MVKKKTKNRKKVKIKRSKKRTKKKYRKRRNQIKRKSPKKKHINRLKSKIVKKIKKNKKKIIKTKKLKKNYNRSITIAVKLLRASEKIKSLFNFKFNLDKSIQGIFLNMSKKILSIKKAIEKEQARQKRIKLRNIEREKLEADKKFRLDQDLLLREKKKEVQDEIKLEKERKKDLQRFIRIEQAEVRKEQAEKQRKFLEQIKLEKKIEQFRKREALEIKNLEKYVLGQQRESYALVEERIQNIKIKYQKLRDQKIAERVRALGVEIEEGDDRSKLLEKEKLYYLERQKIEFALESFYRSAHSLCFQLNKKYIPKYLNILRCVDLRMERGEIFIKWDDTPDDDWLILIYIKNNSPEEGIVIEDKTDPEKSNSNDFKSNEIFKASDLMVDALTKLLDKERNKRKAS